MRRIPLADAGFLYLEKRQTPMHVGGLHLFTLPDDVDEAAFLLELAAVLKMDEAYRRPFGDYVSTGAAGPLGPLYWKADKTFDIDYHVRHSALPKPGRFRELFMLISRLHGTLLDRSRPLWEFHLIEGLQNRQFAMYMKVHHAVTDGVASMHTVSAMYSTDQNDYCEHSPFSLEAFEAYKTQQRAKHKQQAVIPDSGELRNVSEALKQQLNVSGNLFGAFKRFGSTFFGGGEGLAVPWHNIPRTSINTDVTGSRRFVAQSWDFDRINRVAKAMGGTLNDLVLTLCGSALRRYLINQGDLPGKSLKAMTPISLRAKDDFDSANAVSFMIADLATHLDDPAARMRCVQASMQAGKKLMNALTPREAMIFTQVTQIPALFTSVLGLTSKFPAFSTVISNVPGPREQLYWNGASLDGMYPVSIVFDGFAMNITLVSYNNKLHFGIIACRRAMPHVQRLIDYLEDSLQELEEVAGLITRPGKKAKSRPKRKMAPKKAVTKTAATTTRTKAKPRPKAKPKSSP
ncbi:MAG: WS/DGAT/MGAT family O-acyltransferase [Parahaliea sp.]